MDCMISPLAHLDDIPPERTEGWANVLVDVLEFLEQGSGPEDEQRALKWLLILHDVLCRLPPRGGRRGQLKDTLANASQLGPTETMQRSSGGGSKTAEQSGIQRIRGTTHQKILKERCT